LRIITASKFYFLKAGLERYLFNITETLRNKGHEVIPFSSNYKKNLLTDYDKYFAEYIELGGEEKITLSQKLTALKRIFYNEDSAKKMGRLLDDTKPDIVWGFGVHRHLSPSIFMEAKKRNIPVMHRLSDYNIICPDSRLTKGDDSICYGIDCPTKGYHNAIKHRCVRLTQGNKGKKASLAASIIGAAELYMHNKLKFYVNNVDKFIAPSNFLRNTMITAGIPENKIVHVPIYIDAFKYTPQYESSPYLLYFGRLNWEKGLPILLDAMAELKHIKLMIVGDGPERENLEKIKNRKNLVNVEFTGKLYGNDLSRIIKNSRAVVLPSVWFDNSPHVIFEAFANGKPVIGANIGGIPEYIDQNTDGLLYTFNNSGELADKINFLMSQPAICKEMGISARKKVELFYNPRVHYIKVMSLMEDLVNNNKIKSQI
jgi:glycosyltransferase involved in cell wall biosynthesis